MRANLPPLEEWKECQHQFFEIRDISYAPFPERGKDGQLIMYPPFEIGRGKLVMCALCGERRQLWQNGDILFFIDGEWQKLSGM